MPIKSGRQRFTAGRENLIFFVVHFMSNSSQLRAEAREKMRSAVRGDDLNVLLF